MSQCLLAAVDRDALSGWGAEVIIMSVPPPFSALSSLLTSLAAHLKEFTRSQLKFVKIRLLFPFASPVVSHSIPPSLR
jgi:hypothetical protein